MPAKRKRSAAEGESVVLAKPDSGSRSAVQLYDSSPADFNHDHDDHKHTQDHSNNNSNNSNNSNNNKNSNINTTGTDANADADKSGGYYFVACPLVVSDCPFTVEFRSILDYRLRRAGPVKKRSKSLPHTDGGAGGSEPPPPQSLHQIPPNDNTTVFFVRPDEEWRRLGKYRNFLKGTETFSLNEFVFVNPGHLDITLGQDVSVLDDCKLWVARVLEIRAEDPTHVYLRVYWMYSPDELPGGRLSYHGTKELVASNHMEIIDAMAVSGRADVFHWLEQDKDEDLPSLFWRQKLDLMTQTLSEVRRHCRCRRYYNPDLLMVACPNNACSIWLHEECIADDIKHRVFERGSRPPPPSTTTTTTIAATTSSPAKLPLKRKGSKREGKRGGGGLSQADANSFVSFEPSHRTRATTAAAAAAAAGASAAAAAAKLETETKKKTPQLWQKSKEELERELEMIHVTYNAGEPTAHVKVRRHSSNSNGGGGAPAATENGVGNSSSSGGGGAPAATENGGVGNSSASASGPSAGENPQDGGGGGGCGGDGGGDNDEAFDEWDEGVYCLMCDTMVE